MIKHESTKVRVNFRLTEKVGWGFQNRQVKNPSNLGKDKFYVLRKQSLFDQSLPITGIGGSLYLLLRARDQFQGTIGAKKAFTYYSPNLGPKSVVVPIKINP